MKELGVSLANLSKELALAEGPAVTDPGLQGLMSGKGVSWCSTLSESFLMSRDKVGV